MGLKENMVFHMKPTKAKLVFTTHKYSFGVYDFDTDEISLIPKIPELETLYLKNTEFQTFNPYGIIDDGNIIITSNTKCCVFNKNFEYSHNLDLPLYPDTHGIDKHNEFIFAANTSTDTIGIYFGKDYKFLDTLNFKLVDAPKITSQITHVNTVHYNDNKLYFCLHNKNVKPSEFGYIDLNTFEVTRLGSAGLMAHSIRITDNILYSLSSGTGELIQINLNSNTIVLHKLPIDDNIFIRGLEVYNNKLYIGCSVNYKKPKHLGKWASILAYDLQSRQCEYLIKDFKEIRYINDLKVVYE
jgi:hypothetical protein